MRHARIGLLLITIAVVGCAPKQRQATITAPPAPTVDAAALIRRGCFHCFEQALVAALAAGNTHQAFEAAGLIVLRAKELGLPLDARTDTMRRLVPPGPGWAMLLDIVSAAPVNPLSGARYEEYSVDAIGARQRTRQSVEGWRAALPQSPASPLFRAYLQLMLDCEFTNRDVQKPDDPARAARGEWPDTPVIEFRAATCGGDQPTALAAVRAADADFMDAEYYLGRAAGQGRTPDLEEALRHLQAAVDAFPESAAIATTLGRVRLDREEWLEALAVFDGIIARMPMHRDALLGRTISLSQLRRHEDAIASATRMIDLGEWLLGEAYYWRAWNELQLKRLTEAAADRDRAKTLVVNSALYLLSGLIEWGQRHLPQAESEFQQSLTMDFGRCDAALYLGAVRFERSERPAALAAFKQSIQCYDLAIGLRRKMIDDVRSAPGSDAGKARLIASHERAIAEATAQREQAAKDAATIDKLLNSAATVPPATRD